MRTKSQIERLSLFLTPEQASKISGLGVNRIRQLMEDGQLEYLPVGNRKPACQNRRNLIIAEQQAVINSKGRQNPDHWILAALPKKLEQEEFSYGNHREKC